MLAQNFCYDETLQRFLNQKLQLLHEIVKASKSGIGVSDENIFFAQLLMMIPVSKF